MICINLPFSNRDLKFENEQEAVAFLDSLPTFLKEYVYNTDKIIDSFVVKKLKEEYKKYDSAKKKSNPKSPTTQKPSPVDLYESVLKRKTNNVMIINGINKTNFKSFMDEVEKSKGTRPIYSMRLDSEAHFGNPFSPSDELVKKDDLIKTSNTKNAVSAYMRWLTSPNPMEDTVLHSLIKTKKDIEKLQKFEQRRKWILENIKSSKLSGRPILYYKDLGEPSHADALDFLINEYNWNGEKKALQHNFKAGDVVEYKGKPYLLFNVTKDLKAELIKEDKTKLTEFPSVSELKYLGATTVVNYQGNQYIVTKDNDIYSTVTGNLLFEPNDKTQEQKRKAIIEQANKIRNNKISDEPRKQTITSKENPLEVFVDGSDIKSTNAIGFGVYAKYNNKEYGISGAFDGANLQSLEKDLGIKIDGKVSNYAMELYGSLVAIRNTPSDEYIHIKQDLEGVQFLILGELLQRLGKVNFPADKSGKEKYKNWWLSLSEEQRRKLFEEAMSIVALDSDLMEKSRTINHENKEGKNFTKYTRGQFTQENYTKAIVSKIVDLLVERKGKVKYTWVKGHSKLEGNDKADKLSQDRNNFNTYKNLFEEWKPKEQTTKVISSASLPDSYFTKGKLGVGDNISSYSSDLGFALTNPVFISPSGYEWKRDWNDNQKAWREYMKNGIVFNGKKYRDVEDAYQKNKNNYPIGEARDNFMKSLIKIKLETYPKLIELIDTKGGVDYLRDSIHQPTKQNSHWETGGNNAFIKALTQAYLEVKQQAQQQTTQPPTQQPPQQTTNQTQQNISITTQNYTQQLVRDNPDTAFVFTENTHSITAFPNRIGGGSAVIRPEPNAFPIVTKKKYDYNTRENVDYTDTPENFKEFVDINTKLINDIKNSGKSKVVFPKGFATDQAKMPTRFAEWLQKALLDNFGLVTELNATKTGLISKSVNQPQQSNLQQVSEITPELLEKQNKGEAVVLGESKKGFKLSIDKKGKDQAKADLANAFIGYGLDGTSTKQYELDAKKAGIPINDEIKPDENTIAFVSVNGNNKATDEAIEKTILTAREIIEKGGTVIMDSTYDANRIWNKNGEAIVQEQLGVPTGQTSKGYNYWGKNPETQQQTNSFNNPFETEQEFLDWLNSDWIDVPSETYSQYKWIKDNIDRFKGKPIYFTPENAEHAETINKLINGKQSNQPQQNKIIVVSKDYGVVQVETNPSKEKTEQFVNLIRPQIKSQLYKENKGKNANGMFYYGLMWSRKKQSSKPVKINSFDGGSYYAYHELDQNGNPLPDLSVLQPIIDEIQNNLGLDMSDYDSVIGNVYLDDQYIYPHKDTTESKTARNYPVIVYTIGNDAGLGIVDNNEGKMTFANQYDKQWLPEQEKLKGYTNELQTKNGSIYTFGLDGKGRFELTHSTPMNNKKTQDFPPITLPDGRIITKYTITLTFRRAKDLDSKTPASPKRLNDKLDKALEQSKKNSTSNNPPTQNPPATPPPPTPEPSTEQSEEDIALQKILSKITYSDKDLLNNSDTSLKVGSLVEYKGEKYVVRSLDNPNKVELIQLNGNALSDTPKQRELKVLGNYPVVRYDNNNYIVMSENKIYSLSSKRLGLTSKDVSTIVHKQKIINSIYGLKSNGIDDDIKYIAFDGNVYKIDYNTGIVVQINKNLENPVESSQVLYKIKTLLDFEEAFDLLKESIEKKFPTITYQGRTYAKTSIENVYIDLKTKLIVRNLEVIRYLNYKLSDPLLKYELFPGVFANEEQKKAIDIFTDFIDDRIKGNFALLKGRGGTGKTTIIKKITGGRNVLYIAPTHKAKNVLSKSTSSNAITLASALGIKLNELTGKFEIDEEDRKKKGIAVSKAKYIVIDEASMISDELFDELAKHIKPDAKVIFMGDNAQLEPPGQETESKVFQYTLAELKQRMRQDDDSPILPITDAIAENIEKEAKAISDPIRTIKTSFDKDSNSGVIAERELDVALQMWLEDYKLNPQGTKIITYRNQLSLDSPQSVYNINRKARKLLRPNEKEEFVKGEIITSYSTIVEEGIPVIENSCDYIIEEIRKVSNQTITIYAKKGGRERQYPLTELNGYYVKLRDVLTGRFVNEEFFLPDSQTRQRLIKLKDDLYEGKNGVTQDRQIAYLIGEYIPEFEYGYAITSHKSQGSTYRNVYVLKDNILSGTSRTNKQKNKALYVATSRASDKLVIQSLTHSISNKDLIIKNGNQTSHLDSKKSKEKDKEFFVPSYSANIKVLVSLTDFLSPEIIKENDQYFRRDKDGESDDIYFEDGNIFINTDKFKLSNPISSLTPLFLGIIKLQNPELYQKLSEPLKKQSFKRKEIEDKYKGQKIDIEFEILSDAIKNRYSNYPSSLLIEFDNFVKSKIEQWLGNSISSDSKVDNKVREKYFPKDVMKASEILDLISKSQHPLNKVAQHLKQFVKANDVDIVLIPEKLIEDRAIGLYYHNENYIEIAEFGRQRGNGVEIVLIHEIVHALTFHQLSRDAAARKTLDEIYQYAKANITSEMLSDRYALTDLDEFIVGIFSDSKLIKAMINLPPINKTKKSVFQEVIDYILSLFNINQNDNLYTEAFNAATEVLKGSLEVSEFMAPEPSLEEPEYIKSEYYKIPIPEYEPEYTIRYQKANSIPSQANSLEEGINWIRSVMKDANIELTEELIDGIGRGSYDTVQDLIKLSKRYADKKTTKHEVFHRAFNLLSEEKREKILNEGSKLFNIERGRIKNNKRYQIIGQKANLSFDEQTKLLKALAYEERGYTPEEIRRLTNWEKGVDGKWRYELEPLKFNKNFLKKMLQREGQKAYLTDIIDGDIFNYYPQLRSVVLETFDLGEEVRGYANNDENIIGVSVRSKVEDVERTLSHEIQHFIQYYEGFATGGNVKGVLLLIKDEDLPRIIQEEIVRLEDLKLNNFDKSFEEFKKVYDSLTMKDIMTIVESVVPFARETYNTDGYINYLKLMSNFGFKRAFSDYLLNFIHKMSEKDLVVNEVEKMKYIPAVIEKLQELSKVKSPLIMRKVLRQYLEEYNPKKFHELYQRLAGETEARNVAKRRELTPEERRSKSLAETEDKPRATQFVVYDSQYPFLQLSTDYFTEEDIKYTGDLAIEEKIAEMMENTPDEKLPKTLLGRWIQSVRNFFRNLFKERTQIERFLRDINQGRIPNDSERQKIRWLRKLLPDANKELLNNLAKAINKNDLDTIDDLVDLSKKYNNNTANKYEIFYKAFSLLSEEDKEKILNEGSRIFRIPRENDIDTKLYQIIGKNAKLSKNVRNNLTKAKLMESEGKDKRTIRIATGWERGVDNKWRYEIEPIRLRIEDKLASYRQSGNNDFNLSDIVLDKEIISLYPKTKNIKVSFDETLQPFLYGYTDYQKNQIILNPNIDIRDIESSFVHELQHFIQRYEGFAKGSGIRQVLFELSKDNIKDIIKEEIKTLREEDEKVFSINLESSEELIEKIKSEKQARINYLNYLMNDKEIISEDYRKLSLYNYFKDNYDDKKFYELYKKVAGEVEARNVELRRLFATPEMRRKILLSESEDVVREQQFVIGATPDLEIEERLADSLDDDNLPSTLTWLDSVKDFFKNLFLHRTTIEQSMNKKDYIKPISEKRLDFLIEEYGNEKLKKYVNKTKSYNVYEKTNPEIEELINSGRVTQICTI